MMMFQHNWWKTDLKKLKKEMTESSFMKYILMKLLHFIIITNYPIICKKMLDVHTVIHHKKQCIMHL